VERHRPQVLRLSVVAALVLAVAAGAAPAGAPAPHAAPQPKPNPCKGAKAKCPSWLSYLVTVSYTGTENTVTRSNGALQSKRTRTITWSVHTPEPVKLYHVGAASLGNIAGAFSGKGVFDEKVTSTTYQVCDGTPVLTREESFSGEAPHTVLVVSSTHGGAIPRPKYGPVYGTYAIADPGYTCRSNGSEIRTPPHTETRRDIRTLSFLVLDGARHALFSVGSAYGDPTIRPDPIEGDYHGKGVDSSWTWTFVFQRAD